MNPFAVLEEVQEAYLSYVHTFQKFNNPAIRDWVAERVRKGTLLWKEPYIQLSRDFERGQTFSQLVDEGLLHPDTPKCFTGTRGDRGAELIQLYQHQSEAIRAIQGGHNTVVATGTGSGKSFCFGVPIVSKALRLRGKGIAGIKAVIVYPMNALANSQYEDFAQRLAGSGLKLGLYTGDTKTSPDEALEQYRTVFGRDLPFDSELLSREEIRERPPDILMTNFVMLELLLTRFEDRVLFPPRHHGVLRFLVLDEIHTYTGKQGADVACLIRRLKQHTNTIGKLRCIGTSATVESGEGEDSRSLVAAFASDIFGEPFAPKHVIGETYAPLDRDLPALSRAIAEALAEQTQSVGQLSEQLHVPREEIKQALVENGTLPPKLHSFFSQGRAISACIQPDQPHLNDRGEVTCPICAQDGKPVVPTFPLNFCRACGQEFFGVSVTRDGILHPREIDAAEYEGEPYYLYAQGHDPEQAPLPDNWLTPKGNLKSAYRDVAPDNRVYCPDCHRLVQSGPGTESPVDVAVCGHGRAFPVCLIPVPFLLCPQCGIAYDRRPREFSKLFTFGTVGRSTATDVLIANTLTQLPEDQRKLIAFSDNRQDTAFQAAHINSLQKRLAFRRGVYHALRDGGCVVGTDRVLHLDEAGLRIFESLDKHNALPQYTPDVGEFRRQRAVEAQYQEYLEYALLLDLEATHRRLHQNLEDVGVLMVSYDGLDRLADAQEVWDAVEVLGDCSPDLRYDYLHGFLDIMRKRLAVEHPALVNYRDFEVTVVDKLRPDALLQETAPNRPVGFSDTAIAGRGWASVYRFVHYSTSLVRWARRALSLSYDEAAELIGQVVQILSGRNVGFLVEHPVRRVGALYMIPADLILLQVSDDCEHRVCPRCGSVQHFRTLDFCTGTGCGPLWDRDLGGNYFRQQYTAPLDTAVRVVAAEHSGQVHGDERKEIEAKFKADDQDLNVLVCTPTMELGIDIGNLSAIYMRNVPPSPSRYAQRAGRAGRQGQPSVITVFCGVGMYRGPHDQYFYRFPEKIISGRIASPRFLLDNKPLLLTHVHSLILESLSQRLPTRPREVLDIDDAPGYPFRTDLQAEYGQAVHAKEEHIQKSVEEAFAAEIEAFDWLDQDVIKEVISTFVDDLDKAFERWRAEYAWLNNELQEINRRLGREKPDRALDRRRTVIEHKLAQMRDGEKDWYIYRYLAGEGFLPNYAFPRQSTVVSFDFSEDDLARDPSIALNEYAPGNTIYYRGSKYIVTHARPRTREMVPDTRQLLICPACDAAYMDEDANRSLCRCGADLRGVHTLEALHLPDMFAQSRERITADEEERLRLGYAMNSHYHPGGRVKRFAVKAGAIELLRMSYEHNGRILMVNSGSRQAERKGEPDGFTLCTKCHRWLLSDKAIDEHLDTGASRACRQHAGAQDLLHSLRLFTDIQTDVLVIEASVPDEIGPDYAREFYTTLRHALSQAVGVTLNLDQNELGGFLAPDPSDPSRLRIILHETAIGGAGALASLTEKPRLRQVVARARELLHEGDPEEGCQKACYDCLLSFYNQPDHEFIDRTLVLPFLRSLEGLTIEPVEVTSSGPPLEGLDAQCQSDFERQVLHAIADKGLPLPDGAQKTIYEGDEPIAIADFFYEPKLLIFVDGSPHYRDYVETADESKRRRLKAKGYRIVAITDIEGGLAELRARLGV